ncbi:ATP phosphoribosyltransferase [Chitinophaga parva]|uniref:ATP phosphoribosyltransferase n=1 Tax=Chitinophaga parva TaxID=2169414 RepID=A0A2T7BFT1_9BACT|nr:ATP phosphoribosyltransferase [Chitinophaga parva]PUZ25083.1 ATP phosphoribosyltransferase [Chitinophaga parva]
MSAKLKIAVQKSGRLHDDSMKLLKECGIDVNNGVNRLKTEASNFPLELFFLRDDDIPQYVEDGVADIGMVGENVVFEKEKQVKIVEKLGFGKCRLSIAVPKNVEYNGINDLHNMRIATSYPVIVADYLKKHKVQAEIHEISGSVEIAPGIGLADAICDLVSSGSTLFMNGLKEVEVMLKSEAVLVANKDLTAAQQQLLDKLLFRMRAVRKAKNNKYILLNAPNDNLEKIISLLPGMKSPTVLPLAEAGWSSVHSVLNENEFWDIIESLKEAGAQGILVVPIEKMII